MPGTRDRINIVCACAIVTVCMHGLADNGRGAADYFNGRNDCL